MQASSLLTTDVRYLAGVGPARARLLQQLDIRTIQDLLRHYPRRYEDRSQLVPLDQLQPETWATVRAAVKAVHLRRSRRGLAILEVKFTDAGGVIISAVWFNQPYLRQQFRVGQEYILYGKVALYGKNQCQLQTPEYELVEPGDESSVHYGRIVPVYPAAERLSQRYLRALVDRALAQYEHRITDPLPQDVRRRAQVVDLQRALHQIHFPADETQLARARERLVFEECLVGQVVSAMHRCRRRALTRPHGYQLDGPLTRALLERLPFTLTDEQERALVALREDFSAPYPMNRLLQGDVGCGKTVVAAWCLAAAVQSGLQAAVMAPTEILAEQHSRTLRQLLEPLGVRVVVLVSDLSPAERRKRLAAIADGQAQVVIGTHAIVQPRVKFRRLALVVIDEQHKFGVLQRALLKAKGMHPDTLVMTATPIPRTLAMACYGELDVTTIRELPPGRKPVVTRWVREAERDEVYRFMREQFAQGRQAYVVYPLVEESSRSELRAATQMAKRLQAVFPSSEVGLLHGRLGSEAKERVMRQFQTKQIQLLVTTIVIEVGIDVPAATVMFIEHAERFGLAQLHQLRGRIGRRGEQAYCFVCSEATGEEASARLKAFVETHDGFALAELDLRQRGPGEWLGVRQHGAPALTLANLLTDEPVLQRAREEADYLVQSAPRGAAEQFLRGYQQQGVAQRVELAGVG